MDGGAVVGAPDGAWSTVWRRDKEVLLAAPGKTERSLGTGIQPWVALGPGGPFVAWLEKANGSLLIAGPKKEPVSIAGDAQNPAIAGALDGKGPVVVAWATSEGVMARALVARK